jgi:hypothetical protein
MSNDSVSILFPAAVRDRVLEQHRVLRDLLRRALATTTRSFQANPPDLTELASLVHELRARFGGHLAFEEHALVPVLANVDLWGQERVQALLAEHARQRSELDTLVEGLESGWDLERLAFTLRSLVTDLLLDMEEEERACLSAELLQEDLMIVGRLRE